MWVGECRELGTATDGRSLERVEQELGRLVQLDLDALEELGERERLFMERGIAVYPAELPRHVSMSVPVNGSNWLVQARPIKMPAGWRERAAV